MPSSSSALPPTRLMAGKHTQIEMKLNVFGENFTDQP
jgi:hypothetical protein